MRASFTGAQSSGKTTLLDACKEDEAFVDFDFVDEVTRKVKREYGVEINENCGDETQYLIAAEHLQNAFRKLNVWGNSPNNLLMDRCIVDGLVYTSVLRDMGKVKSAALVHMIALAEIILPRMDVIFYTEPLPVVDDGVRATNMDFHARIVREFNSYIETASVRHLDLKFISLPPVSVEERIKIIKETLEI
tara:strand:- start:10503 stop:11075 length:573 start_codon:yes stop_codon:yes gene_type:complete